MILDHQLGLEFVFGYRRLLHDSRKSGHIVELTHDTETAGETSKKYMGQLAVSKILHRFVANSLLPGTVISSHLGPL